MSKSICAAPPNRWVLRQMPFQALILPISLRQNRLYRTTIYYAYCSSACLCRAWNMADEGDGEARDDGKSQSIVCCDVGISYWIDLVPLRIASSMPSQCSTPECPVHMREFLRDNVLCLPKMCLAISSQQKYAFSSYSSRFMALLINISMCAISYVYIVIFDWIYWIRQYLSPFRSMLDVIMLLMCHRTFSGPYFRQSRWIDAVWHSRFNIIGTYISYLINK